MCMAKQEGLVVVEKAPAPEGAGAVVVKLPVQAAKPVCRVVACEYPHPHRSDSTGRYHTRHRHISGRSTK